MKSLTEYITERFVSTATNKYNYFPNNKKELRTILEERLEKDKNANLNDIGVSNIKYMDYLFRNLDPHKIDISRWDVSNVEDMTSMFENCKNFNCDLSKWKTNKVLAAKECFSGCTHFDCDLSDWNVSKIQDMMKMFNGCESFKGKGLKYWDVSGVTVGFTNMFCDCINFTEDLSDWNISNALFIGGMFENCRQFNCNLSKWNLKNIIYTWGTFKNCVDFEGKGLENWKLDKVTSTREMFKNCKKLNVDLSVWNLQPCSGGVSSDDIKNMFGGCDTLVQNGLLPKWYIKIK